MINKSNKYKFELYIISLWLLFLLIIVITIDIPISKIKTINFDKILELSSKNLVSLVSLVFLFLGVFYYYKFNYKMKGTSELPFEISECQNSNYEHLTFLTTYIVPLICFNLTSTRYLIALFILLIVIGCIYVKTDMFYANPSLALLGYSVYKVNYFDKTGEKNIILISRDKVKKGDYIKYIQIDSSIYYGRLNK